mmetsp:Transcript_29822/g.75123  ORF Transcript_29822/g.75123 Transcript_29822/m.75123 type:complete len:211 (+) Transcript_29822:650-1282(+)
MIKLEEESIAATELPTPLGSEQVHDTGNRARIYQARCREPSCRDKPRLDCTEVVSPACNIEELKVPIVTDVNLNIRAWALPQGSIGKTLVHIQALGWRPLVWMSPIKGSFGSCREACVTRVQTTAVNEFVPSRRLPLHLIDLRLHKFREIRTLAIDNASAHTMQIGISSFMCTPHVGYNPTALRPTHHGHLHHLCEDFLCRSPNCPSRIQ